MAAFDDTDDGEVLTGAELFHYLTKQNEQQLAENRRKLQEYTGLQDILQRITDRCRVPILAPVAGGLAYFESTIDHTNNILVFLGDGWFAERSAKQAYEIAGRRLEYLRREESALVVEAGALMERQNLFLLEVPNAERAMAEVQASKENVLRGGEGKLGGHAAFLDINSVSQETKGGTEKKETPLQLGLGEQDLAVIDEFDCLTEEELLQIEEELGERIEDDELVERIMTEKLILKKEKRVREALKNRQAENTQPHRTATVELLQNKEEEVEVQQESHDVKDNHNDNEVLTGLALAFTTPGDIGRAAAFVMGEKSTVSVGEMCEAKQRRVRFKDVVDVVEPEETATSARLPDVSYDDEKYLSTRRVLGDVVEHDATVFSQPTSVAAPTATVTTSLSRKKSLFRSELEAVVIDREKKD